jgi:hypothetical protein
MAEIEWTYDDIMEARKYALKMAVATSKYEANDINGAAEIVKLAREFEEFLLAKRDNGSGGSKSNE